MIKIETIPIPIAADTHSGMSGKNNEDNYSVSAYQNSRDDETTSLLAVISDGVGGHQAGEIASEMAVDIITSEIANSDVLNPIQSLIDAITFASQEIYSASQTGKGRLGMGATVACVWLIGKRLYAATVGDSRIYLIRRRSIRQLSIDHTWIQEALDLGVITPNDVQGHPNSHVIRRYLGSPEPPDVDVRIRMNDRESAEQSVKHQGEVLQKGDIIVLCTDGLTDLVSDAEILVEYTDNPLDSAVENLIELANNRGGHDNITIISTKIPEDQSQKLPSLNNRRFKVGCIVAVGITLLIALIVLGWLFLLGRAGDWIKTPLLSTAPGAENYQQTIENKEEPAIINNIDTPAITETIMLGDTANSTLTPWPTHTPHISLTSDN